MVQLTEDVVNVSIPFNFPNMLYGFVFPEDVEGYLSADEGAYLYTMARLAPPGLVVELGAYKGKSAICLAQAGKVYTVDHFLGERFSNLTPDQVRKEGEALGVHADHYYGEYFEACKRNLERYGVAGRVEIVVGETAASAANFAEKGDRVALLFIDANHSYAGVRADFEAYLPLLHPGSAVVFDDRGFPGVARLLGELENEYGWSRQDGPGKLAAMYPPQETVYVPIEEAPRG